ncbi:MAG: hypothetical protein JW888_09550 [Pirellulales bacterium]|nr:hypothetical protein [Pirellulales bacterium]
MAKASRTSRQAPKRAAKATDSPNEPVVQPAETDSPEVRSAADAVRRAKLELEKAQNLYAEVRQEAVERLEKVRQTTVGDVIDGTLEIVRKRPTVGLGVAALIGFFLGRLFRR